MQSLDISSAHSGQVPEQATLPCLKFKFLGTLQALDFSGRMKRGTLPFEAVVVAAGALGALGAAVALCAASDTCGLVAAAGLDVRRANF